MAKGTNTGNGLVITLVVFILLAIAGIGFSIYLYHQLSIAGEEIEANQREFQRNIGEVFDDAGWELTRITPPTHGIRYGREAYSEIHDKLRMAAAFDRMQPLLDNWTDVGDVEDALEQYAPEDSNFNTVDGLLQHYSERYRTLRNRVNELNTARKELLRDLEDKDQEMQALHSELNEELEYLEESYGERLAEIRAQYSELEKKWQQAKEDRWPSFASLHRRIEEMEGEMERDRERLEQAIQQKQELQEQLQPEVVDRLVPEGQVITVERGYEDIMISGGADEGRQRNDRIVIYRTTADGRALLIGEAVVARVYDTTSLAKVIERDPAQPLMEGQFFTDRRTWEYFDPVANGLGMETGTREDEGASPHQGKTEDTLVF